MTRRIYYHAGLTPQPTAPEVYLAHDRDLAEAYAEDVDGATVYELENLSERPLVLATPEAFVGAWDESGAGNVTGRFHPDQTSVFAGWARQQGFDAIVLPESAFEGELGYSEVAGRFGEPQTIVLDPRLVRPVL